MGEISGFTIYMEAKPLIESTIFKYNGLWLYEKDPRQQWWESGQTALIWWEEGRHIARWEEEGFDGCVFQRAAPIPIGTLFQDPQVAKIMAKTLHKQVADPINITELLRVTRLDFSNIGITSLEGLQFLFNLAFINLKNTTVELGEAVQFLGEGVKIIL